MQLRREGAGIGAGRPHRRRRRPLRARGGAARRRVGAARRLPGPALPRRGGDAPGLAVRHRARRAARGLSARRPRPAGRTAARRPAAQGLRRGRLVDPTAARRLARLRRPRRRAARRDARPAGRRPRAPGQEPVGRRGVRGRAPRRPAAEARGALAAHVRPAQGPPSPPARRRALAVGVARPARRVPRRRAGPAAARRRDRRRRDAASPRTRTRWWRCPCSADAPSDASPTAGGGRSAAGATLPAEELPETSPAGDGPPPVNRWADKDPDAAARLAAARAHLAALAEQWDTPVENLLQPDLVRRLCWTPPEHLDADAVDAVLAAGGARPWQRELAVPGLLEALHAAAPADAAQRPRQPRGSSGDARRRRRTRGAPDAGTRAPGRPSATRRTVRPGRAQDHDTPGHGAGQPDAEETQPRGQVGTVAPVFSDPDG